MPIVKMPDGTDVRFPDDMPKEQIKGIISTKFPEIVGDNNELAKLQPMNGEQKLQASQFAEQIRPERSALEQINNIFVKDTLENSGTRAALMAMQGISNAAFNPAGYAARAAGIDTKPVEPQNFVDRAIEKGQQYAYDGSALATLGSGAANVGLLGQGQGLVSKGLQAILNPDIATASISSAGGGALEGAVDPKGLVGQIVTNMLGGGAANMLRPSSWSSALPAAQQSVADLFKRLGAKATAGDVRGGEGIISGIDGALQKTFLGSNLKKAKAEQIKNVGEFYEDLVRRLANNSNINPLVSGSRAAKQTKESLMNRAGKIYENAASMITANRKISLKDVKKLANDGNLSAFRKEAPDAFSMTVGDKVSDVLKSLPNSISQKAYKPFKSFVGEKISPSLISDTDQAQWRNVYGKLAEAQRNLYKNDPKALKAFDNANRAYKGIVEFTEDYLDPMIKKKYGSQVVNEALAKGQDAKVINTLRRNADPKDVDNLIASWLQDAGSVVNPETGALEFSPTKLSTHLAKLKPKVRNAMFGNTQIGEDVNDLAKVSNIIAKGLKNGKDPSNLSNTTATSLLSVGAASDPVTTASAAGGVKGLSYLLQNPEMIQSLIKGSQSLPVGIANALKSLSIEKGLN